MLKSPFRIHSNKKSSVKPKLVPSIVFKDSVVWGSKGGLMGMVKTILIYHSIHTFYRYQNFHVDIENKSIQE